MNYFSCCPAHTREQIVTLEFYVYICVDYWFELCKIVVQTVWKVGIGRDGIEAGTNLVPDSVPRSIARVSVTVVALALSLFVLKSLLSTVFFVLATMGLVCFTFIALNKDEGPKGGGGTTSTPKEEGGDGGLSRRSQKNHGEV
ncbi:uncharacterized protein Pyn_31740 [Prunus yedoensis var. nudiflora]|uniref:Uncharacterized protein n=1 Tax=Prunus yedoensis var. nudiflora TaxID=2094558 RepID=A0A314UD45_PRUYE|nr:uncharacterized protein Pyn_31740 [Prunus yedoensis var. nudiflora]